MFAGRLLGWLLLGLAAVLASGDVVLALGPGEHAGIAAGEIVMLLSGYPTPDGLMPGGAGWRALAGFVWHLPVWAVIGPIGVGVCYACRRRPRRFRFRPD